LRRGQTGVGRLVDNEKELVDCLLNRGFHIVDIGSDTLELFNAKIVVSIEGSHVSHCTATLPENAGIVLLQPRFATIHRGWANNLSVHYGLVVVNQTYRGTYFSKDEILKTVDLMLRKIESV
jgi:capsular polysaccharide biosynthesis protein